MSKQFLNLLGNIQPLKIKEQERKLELEFDTWKEGFRQIDDVLVIGLKV